MEKFAIQEDGEETEFLRRIMTEERGMYPSVMLPGESFGADLLLLGRRIPKGQQSSNKKDWLLIKVQAKAQRKA